ncbi:MAG TPA: four-carbon acid sugar kinase family protein [Methylomirabilota bacterium]|jgi:uncharacterized protein YgbK (DUF1537 family)|nr:four-carbon acid sugar kinase family protein [Methylomirabilota bacterium]
MRAGIQADDLTGACDTAAVFAARGLETLVLLPGAPLPAAGPPVVVLDTESRALPAAEARARALAAVAQLAAAQPGLLYKKVDSTLRGAVGAELEGALAGAGRGQALLAPAFPAQQRTVIDGLLRLGGQPASPTAMGGDPGLPPTGASVLALLARDGPRPVRLLPLATVRRGGAAVAACLARMDGAVVADAETAADLAVVAEATDERSLVAGSAGLAAALAARLVPVAAPPPLRPRRPLLVVAGSAHPVTRSQVTRLEARGGRSIGPPPGTAAPARDVIASRLAEAARRELEGTPVATLVLTGGETAYSVCRALGATGVRVAGELEPGLALGALVGGSFTGLAVITKAGGFGDPDTLVRIWESCQ